MKKILKAISMLLLLPCMLSFVSCGHEGDHESGGETAEETPLSVPETPAELQRTGAALSEEINREGAVLMKNKNSTLPLKQGSKLAVFGEAQHLSLYTKEKFNTEQESLSVNTLTFQHGYIPWGAGSSRSLGSEGVEAKYDPLDDLRAAQSAGELTIYEPLSQKYTEALDASTHPTNYTEYVPDAQMLEDAAAFADTALVFLSRWDGECVDMCGTANGIALPSWELTKKEKALLQQVSEKFGTVIVMLNTPGPIDTAWSLEDNEDGIDVDAMLFLGYGGMQGGKAVADILLGKVNPSGKLADTWARSLEDYPTTKTFLNDLAYQNYTEDIYLGYRYFETFQIPVNYPFGFGLSYTTFQTEPCGIKCENGTVSATVKVTNTGAVQGKQVVQMYVAAPQGVLGKPSRVLCAFKKTDILLPGQVQELTLSVSLSDLASYDDTGKTAYKSAYVLEAGAYEFYVGDSVRNTVLAGTHTVEETVLVEQLSEQCPTNLKKRLLANGEYEALNAPPKKDKEPEHFTVTEPAFKDHYDQLSDVVNGTVTPDAFVAQMTTSELASFFVSSNGYTGAGPDQKTREKYGISGASFSDGPSGLSTSGTSFACETVIASTWNTWLAKSFGLVVGREAKNAGVDVWAAPAMNLHRNPLAGRNSEYYSEDTFVTAEMAKATVIGAQTSGTVTVLKHFVCNEKEAGKLSSDSRVSERALREIYLKPFEKCIKEADARGLMSSYNLLNGIPVTENYDLLTNIVRKEWGYRYYISGDWNNTKDEIAEINAGNGVRQPAGFCNLNNVILAVQAGRISRETLETGAKYQLNTLMQINRYYAEHGSELCITHTFADGVCTKCRMTDSSINISAMIDPELSVLAGQGE